MVRWLHLVGLCAAGVLSGAPGDPDFSGKWRLSEQSGDTRTVPGAAAMTIAHTGAFVRCTADGIEPAECGFTTDLKERRVHAGAVAYKSIGKWEGRAALVNTIATGPGVNWTNMDRWSLSRDGSTLTIRRESIRLGMNREAVFVYTRADAPHPAPAVSAEAQAPAAHEQQPQPADGSVYRVERGTRVPLILLNSVSTKQSSTGDRVYLQTAFPIMSQGRIVIPPGSYVAGTLTFVKRPGRVQGRGELFLRFDSLTLPNGVTRDFRARAGSADADIKGELDRGEGTIRSEGNRGGDAQTVGEAAASGASVGAIAGSAAGRAGMGAALGGAAGAGAGLMGVLLSRGPEVVLGRGTTLEMVLDRPLLFTAQELSR